MPKVCITIPIYKTKLSKDERNSLHQCAKILNSYQIYFFEPKSLDTNIIRKEYPQIKVIKFEDNYFSSLFGYNELMLDYSFYDAFREYEYLLLYQLDAFVFKAELEYWCDKNYDYIGAPWIASKQTLLKKIELKFKSKSKQERAVIYFKVGNGGFSLRKVATFLDISSRFRKEIENTLQLKKEDYKLMEDVFWSIEVPKLEPKFSIPDYKEAVNFAIDRRPKKAVKLLSSGLPFGCHKATKELLDIFEISIT